MARHPDDDVNGSAAVPGPRVLVAAGGFLLAAGATVAVFLTDNPQLLRVAVVAVAWAFVLATFAAGRRGGDQAAAAAREAQLRRAYEHELDLEVAARREYELELENELRRETEQTMRAELDALRGELTALADLREQVTRVAAMREDIVALGTLRQELGQLHGLRDDMGRLRAELTEQLSSEMLVERIVMRTQAGRLTGEPGRLDDPARTLNPSWGEETPRELTGGWPAIRLDEARETRQFEQVRVERTDVRSAPATHTSASWTPPAPATTMFAGPQPSRLGPPPSATPHASGPTAATPPQAPALPAPPAPQPVEHPRVGPATTAFPLLPPAAVEPVVVEPAPAAAVTPAEPPPSPLDWLGSRSLLDVPAAPEARPEPPRPSPRRRRSDEPEGPAVPEAEARTTEQPGPAAPRVRIEDRGGYRVALPDPPPAVPQPIPAAPAAGPATAPGSANRLAEILAENGGTRQGRRRRRYREDGEPDEVLSRVLGRDAGLR